LIVIVAELVLDRPGQRLVRSPFEQVRAQVGDAITTDLGGALGEKQGRR